MLRKLLLASIGLCLFFGIEDSQASTIVVKNNCPDPIWVATHGGDKRPEDGGGKWSTPEKGGFKLTKGQSRNIVVEKGWSGRIWGRTKCDRSGRCETGDCNGQLECKVSGDPPATLAEYTMDGGGGNDYYDVSLVDGGNNVKMTMKARGGKCRTGSCPNDITVGCPAHLQRKNKDGKVVGCASNGGEKAFVDHATKVCPNAYAYWNDDWKNIGCPSKVPGASVHDLTFC